MKPITYFPLVFTFFEVSTNKIGYCIKKTLGLFLVIYKHVLPPPDKYMNTLNRLGNSLWTGSFLQLVTTHTTVVNLTLCAFFQVGVREGEGGGLLV